MENSIQIQILKNKARILGVNFLYWVLTNSSNFVVKLLHSSFKVFFFPFFSILKNRKLKGEKKKKKESVNSNIQTFN